MSLSPDVLAGPAGQHTELLDGRSARVTPVQPRELRSGSWTRLGGSAVLGDTVTEHTLAGLVEEAQAAARAQGYSRGWAEGRRAAELQATQERAAVLARQQQAEELRTTEHRTAVAGLVAAATGLDEVVSSVCGEVESQALELAAQLVEALVGHELAVAAQPGLDAVRRALALAQGEAVVRVRIHPADRVPELAEVAGTAAVVADPTLTRGDAVIDTTAGVVDARVSAAVARVQAELRS